MGTKMFGCALVALLAVLLAVCLVDPSEAAAARPVPGGCRAAGLCCQGKNLTCRAVAKDKVPSRQKEANKVEGGGSICFCDTACLEIGDCCDDYKRFCQPVDCVVDEAWGEWSECDARCGAGVTQRNKRIIQHPLNGGEPCPITSERIACEGNQCKVARAPQGFDELRESAKIIPASFGGWRSDVKYDPFRDIRRNLFERYQKKSVVDRPTYCMEFEFTEIWSACSSMEHSTTADFVKGHTVCVECQPQVMKKSLGSRCVGHGVLMKETRWKAVLAPGCHGKWVLKARQDECQCARDAHNSFILL